MTNEAQTAAMFHYLQQPTSFGIRVTSRFSAGWFGLLFLPALKSKNPSPLSREGVLMIPV